MIVVLAIPFNAIGVNAQSKSYLFVKTVRVDGYDCYSTPYFEICPSYNKIQGKILYMADAYYLKKRSLLTFMFKDENNSFVSKLKDLRKMASRWNLSIELVAEPESFRIDVEPDLLISCFGEDWDGYEECPVIYIKFPLAWCVKKKRYRQLKDILKKSVFKKIIVKCGKGSIDIPLEFPLNETISEMQKLSSMKQ